MRALTIYILRTLKENKIRTVLLIVTIALTSSFIFTSVILLKQIKYVYIDKLNMQLGNAQLMVTANSNTDTPYYKEDELKDIGEISNNQIGIIESTGTLKVDRVSQNIHIIGAQIEEINQLGNIKWIQKSEKKQEGNVIVIDEEIAQQYALQINDKIKIRIADLSVKFKVIGIVEKNGLFGSNISTVVIPKDVVQNLCNLNEMITATYIQVKDEECIDVIKEIVEDKHEQLQTWDLATRQVVKNQTSTITLALIPLLFIVVVLSIFIIFTCFKIISIERTRVIAVYRSLGSEKRFIKVLFLLEIIIYAGIGGIFGDGVGLICSWYILKMLSGGSLLLKEFFSMDLFVIGVMVLAFSIALTLVSAMLPIYKSLKKSIKDVLISKDQVEENSIRGNKIIWVLVWGIGILMALFPLHQAVRIQMGISAVIICIGIIKSYQWISSVVGIFLKRLLIRFKINLGYLTLQNVLTSKTLTSNLLLLMIGMSSLIVVSITGKMTLTSLANTYRDWHFDICASQERCTRSVLHDIRDNKKVSDVYGMYAVANIKVKGMNTKIGLIDGIDTNKHLDFVMINFENKDEQVINELSKGRNILIAQTLRDELNIKLGQSLKLDTAKGEKEYKVVGFFYSGRNLGSYAIVDQKWLKKDWGEKYYSEIYIKAKEAPQETVKEIKDNLERRGDAIVNTVREMEDKEINSTTQIFALLSVLIVIVLGISGVGAVNNQVLSYFQRKNTLNILRNIGLSQNQYLILSCWEGMWVGLIGGILGIWMAYSLSLPIKGVLRTLGFEVQLTYPFLIIGGYMLGGIISSIGIAMITASTFKRKKISDNKEF